MKLPLKKVTKKLHFLQKNKMKILLPMGKNHVFFLDFRQNLKVKNQKIGLFTFFSTPNSIYMVQNWTQKMTQKITFERNLKDKKSGGGDLYHTQIGRN